MGVFMGGLINRGEGGGNHHKGILRFNIWVFNVSRWVQEVQVLLLHSGPSVANITKYDRPPTPHPLPSQEFNALNTQNKANCIVIYFSYSNCVNLGIDVYNLIVII